MQGLKKNGRKFGVYFKLLAVMDTGLAVSGSTLCIGKHVQFHEDPSKVSI